MAHQGGEQAPSYDVNAPIFSPKKVDPTIIQGSFLTGPSKIFLSASRYENSDT